jgi:hypothetical protein
VRPRTHDYGLLGRVYRPKDTVRPRKRIGPRNLHSLSQTEATKVRVLVECTPRYSLFSPFLFVRLFLSLFLLLYSFCFSSQDTMGAEASSLESRGLRHPKWEIELSVTVLAETFEIT